MAESARSREPFGLGEFALRLGGCLVMVLATWNPSGYSFAEWVQQGWRAETLDAIHAFVGVVLLIGWIILLRAAFNSLGMLGLLLGGLFLGVSVWLLYDLGLLHDQSTAFLEWIALVCIAVLMALGLSWSHIWKRLTGQVDTDDFDGN